MTFIKDNPTVGIGDVFNELTVIGESFLMRGKKGHRRETVVCKCSCGRVAIIAVTDLRRGRPKSCGCIRVAVLRHGETLRKNKGGVRYRLFRVWNGMWNRCFNPKVKCFHNYGGRGITMCMEWERNPTAFIDWAIENGWQPGLQCDRINNDGNYEPGNCRFVTNRQNSQNKRPKPYPKPNCTCPACGYKWRRA